MPTPHIPSDVLLPANAKYFSFLNTKHAFNGDYDITWSFTYSVSNLTQSQQGVATFLTLPRPGGDSFWYAENNQLIPGHYLCCKGIFPATSAYFLTGGVLSAFPLSGHMLTIAFETSGFSALSSTIRPGVDVLNLSAKTLTVRAYNDTLLHYSVLPDNFLIDNNTNVIRCRFSNTKEKLYIDYRDNNNLNFISLAEISTNFKYINASGYLTDNTFQYDNADEVYTGIAFCSPLSSTSTDTASLILHNFHSDGVYEALNREIITTQPIA